MLGVLRRGLAAALIVSSLAVSPVLAETFRFGSSTDILSLDPHAQNDTFTIGFLTNIYEGLTRYDQEGELEPSLATEWEVVSPTLWRFKIRENVKFHNGEELTVDDVAFSLERARVEQSDVRNILPEIVSIKDMGDNVLEIETGEPWPSLPRSLSFILIMNKSWAMEHGSELPEGVKTGTVGYANGNTNGTGPFKVTGRTIDVSTTLVANEDWWDERKHDLTEVRMTPIKAGGTRIAALISGELDMTWPISLQDVARLKSSPDIQVIEGPEERTVFIGLDVVREELLHSNSKNPLLDIRVRQALYHAIDIDAINQRVMQGTATPAGLLAAPSLLGFDPELNDRLAYDPDRARELLAEAGYSDGFEITFDCPTGRYVNDEQLCQAIAAMLARVDVKVNLSLHAPSIYFTKLVNKDTSMYLLGWAGASSREARMVYQQTTTCQDSGFGAAYNAGNYCNPEVDERLRAAAAETDQVKQLTLISEAMKLHKDEVAHIPLHQQGQVWAVRKPYNVVQRPDGWLRLHWVTRQ